MDIIFSKLVVGLVTFILAVLGLISEIKKKEKSTQTGKLVLVLLILLASFSIYSELTKEIIERDEKITQKNKDIEDSKQREKEYKEYIEYMRLLKEKSEKTLSKFDSSLVFQNLILKHSEEINLELEKSKYIQERIKEAASTSLTTLSKNMHQLSSLNDAQTKSLLKIDTLNSLSDENINNLRLLDTELKTLTLPLSPFKIILTMQVVLDDTAFISEIKSNAGVTQQFIYSLKKIKGGFGYFLGLPLRKNTYILDNYEDFREYLFNSAQEFFIRFSNIDYEYGLEEAPNDFYFKNNDNGIFFNIPIIFKRVNSNYNNYTNLKEVFENTTIYMSYSRLLYQDPFKLYLRSFEKGKVIKKVKLKSIRFQPEISIFYGKNLENERYFKMPETLIDKDKFKHEMLDSNLYSAESTIRIELRDSL